MECRDCQTRLLELAYDLLDGPLANEVRAHAESCTACREALRETGRLQALLGRAARLPIDDFRFEVPNAEPAAAPRHTRPTWLPWVVAAGIVLALGIVGTPVMQHYFDRGREVAKISTEGDQPKPQPVVEVPHSRGLKETAPSEWTAAGAGFRCVVLGPEKPAAGKASEYTITGMNEDGSPLTLRITALIKDAEGKQAGSKQSFETPGTFTLAADALESLPPGPAHLHIFATHPITGERAEVVISLR